LIVETCEVGPLRANCHIVGCEDTREAMILDPGGDGPLIVSRVKELDLRPRVLVNTHAHVDHVAADADVMRAFPDMRLLIHRDDARALADPGLNLSELLGTRVRPPEPDQLLEDGDQVSVGRLAFRVIQVPGHTPGGICLHSPDGPDGTPVLFSGDTLFAGGIGRSDFPGGSHEQLIASIRSRLFSLDERCVVYPGHGPITTIGREKRDNPFV